MKEKKKLYIIVALAVTVVLVSIVVIKMTGEGSAMAKTGIEKNYGAAYITTEININQDETEISSAYSAEDVVPREAALISNLEDEGFEIIKADTVFDSDIQGEQIIATSQGSFCSITYGLDQDEADEVFALYENEYSQDQYYIVAKNGTFVYSVSDNDTFEKVGFAGLANEGTQYINHDNY